MPRIDFALVWKAESIVLYIFGDNICELGLLRIRVDRDRLRGRAARLASTWKPCQPRTSDGIPDAARWSAERKKNLESKFGICMFGDTDRGYIMSFIPIIVSPAYIKAHRLDN